MPKKTKKQNHQNLNSFGQIFVTATVDLHGQNRTFEEVNLIIDRFLVSQRIIHLKYFKNGEKIKLGIIVGKGNGSKRLINGKNPLRHWAEIYLKGTDHIFSSKEEIDQTGMIILELE